MSKYLLIISSIFFLASSVFSQTEVILTTDKDSIEAGQSFNLTVDIRTDKPENIQGLDFNDYQQIDNILFDSTFFDEHLDIKILNAGSWPLTGNRGYINKNSLTWTEENGRFQCRNVLKIGVYNFGMANIPAPKLEFKEDEETINFQAPILAIIPSANMTLDSASIVSIKDIIEEPTTLEDFYPLLIGLLVLIIIGSIIYYLTKRNIEKESEQEIEEIEEQIIPAHITALEALDKLREEKLWQQGKIKEYQSQLTHIIRAYLEERYQVPALELTTSEINTKLNKVDFDQSYTQDLTEILTVADLVKFAKATPDDNIHEVFMNKAYDFVNNTKVIMTEGE